MKIRFNQKLISLVVVILFVTASLLVACGDAGDDPVATTAATTEANTPVVEVAKPAVIEITKTYYFGDSTDYVDQKEEYMTFFEEHYGVKLKVNYPARNNYIEVINLSIISGDLSGIVQLFGATELKQWVDDGVVYPLTEYLKDNEVFQSLPETWKEKYTYEGQLWAIPQGSDELPSYFSRSIRGDWLDALNLDVPTTVQELYNASYQFTYNDPDGNGLDDTFGMTSRTTWLMQDLFQAFDCRLNHQGDAVATWNPNTNTWEDPMIKPEMVEALTFLNKMTDEKVMDAEIFVHSSSVAKEKVKSGYYGGFFYWNTWVISTETAVKTVFPDAYMEAIVALKGNIDININSYNTGNMAPMAMTIYTEEPKETINWYVNLFYGSAENVFIGRYGVMGDAMGEGMFTLGDNIIYKNYYLNDEGAVKGYSAPGIVSGHPSYALDSVYEFIYNSPDEEWNAEQTTKKAVNAARNAEWFDAGAAWAGLYLLPDGLKEPSSQIFLDKKGDLLIAANEAISKTMVGEISVADAIANYKTTAKALGAAEILQIANEELGVDTNQTYD